jgi:hypothetical protein
VRQHNPQRGQMVRLNSNIGMEQTVKALGEQPRTDKKHHGGRQLDNDEVSPEVAPESTGRTAPAFRQIVSGIAQGQAQDRYSREKQSGGKRDGACKRKLAAIQTEPLQVRHAVHHRGRDEPGKHTHKKRSAGNAESRA